MLDGIKHIDIFFLYFVPIEGFYVNEMKNTVLIVYVKKADRTFVGIRFAITRLKMNVYLRPPGPQHILGHCGAHCC